MSCDPARNLVDGLLKLGALNVEIGVLMTEAALATSGSLTGRSKLRSFRILTPTDAQIEAVALVIEQEMLGNFELGFQAVLRLNYPRDRLQEIAAKALDAAHSVDVDNAQRASTRNDAE
jgi:hypothetical protein